MDLVVLLESPQGSQSSSRGGACTCAFLTSCSSSVTLPFAWIKGSVAFSRGFPTRLSHEVFPRSFPCVLGKEFPAFPSQRKWRRSPQERREELQSRATIPRVPQMSQSIPGKPVFPALSRLSSRGLTETKVASETALWKATWENLVRKPRGKATDPLIHAKGSVTLLLQLGRKAPVHAPTRYDD